MQAGRLQQGQGLLVFIVLRCPVAGDGEFSNEPARHFWSLAGTWVVAPGGWEVLFPVNTALLVSAGGGDLQELAHFPRLSAT